MSEPISYVGIDAHKVQLHVALLAPDASSPVTWTVQNVDGPLSRRITVMRALSRATAIITE